MDNRDIVAVRGKPADKQVLPQAQADARQDYLDN